MAGTTCSICLDELKDPVSIPCGHIHCEKCLFDYIESGEDAISALCPTCRARFSLAIPDMRVIPKKYHTYIERSIRRVYIPSDASYANTVNSLKAKVTRLESLVDALNRDKSNLMDRCEAHIAKSNTVGKREKAARDENSRLKTELDELKHKYGIVKGKYKTLKNAKPPPASESRAPKRTIEDAFAQHGGPSTNDALRPMCPVPKRPRLIHAAQPKAKVEPEDDPDIDMSLENHAASPSRLGFPDLLPHRGRDIPDMHDVKERGQFSDTDRSLGHADFAAIAGAGPSRSYQILSSRFPLVNRRAPTSPGRYFVDPEMEARPAFTRITRTYRSRASAEPDRPSVSRPRRNVKMESPVSRIDRSTEEEFFSVAEGSFHNISMRPIPKPVDRYSTSQAVSASGSRPRPRPSASHGGGSRSDVRVKHPGPSRSGLLQGDIFSPTGAELSDGGGRGNDYSSDRVFEDSFDDSDEDEPPVKGKGKGKERERLRSYVFRGERLVHEDD